MFRGIFGGRGRGSGSSTSSINYRDSANRATAQYIERERKKERERESGKRRPMASCMNYAFPCFTEHRFGGWAPCVHVANAISRELLLDASAETRFSRCIVSFNERRDSPAAWKSNAIFKEFRFPAKRTSDVSVIYRRRIASAWLPIFSFYPFFFTGPGNVVRFSGRRFTCCFYFYDLLHRRFSWLGIF